MTTRTKWIILIIIIAVIVILGTIGLNRLTDAMVKQSTNNKETRDVFEVYGNDSNTSQNINKENELEYKEIENNKI